MATTTVRAPSPNRETVTTIAKDGSRIFLHPSDVRGQWTLWRRLFAILLIGIYIALPWIPLNGYPAVFFDIAKLRFHLFGMTLAAQDAWMLFFFVSGLGFSLFFITALFGRLWCGWACPHSVFLEQVFRPIERLIEGDAATRRKLDAAPWTGEKVLKRMLKHGLFVAVAAFLAHFFLAYFVSLPGLYQMITHSPLQNWPSFVFMVVATIIVYFNFAWFREQLCIVICPYGRFQSALHDDHTITVGYDARRGEPRGKPGTAGVGDCIDCTRCVQVCPTGIDIRQGMQLECIACAQCIDACDEVMAKLERPPGLIRYDSLARFAKTKQRWVRPRTIFYGVMLVLGAVAFTLAARTLQPAAWSVIPIPGVATYTVTDEVVRNQFYVRVVNKLEEHATFRLSIEPVGDRPLPQLAAFGEAGLVLPALGEEQRPVVLTVPRSAYVGSFPLKLVLTGQPGNTRLERTITFNGPDPRLLPAPAPTHAPAP